MEFNVERLIKVVKERPAIWDTTHNKWYTKNSKLKAWKEIVEIIDREDNDANIPTSKLGPLIQKRWKNLRDAHVKQMKKIQENPDSGLGKNYRLMNRLSFLNRVITTGGRNLNMTTDTEADIWEDTEENEEQEHLPTFTRSRARVKMYESDDNDIIVGPEEVDLDKLVDTEETLDIIHTTDPLETSMDNSVESPLNKKRNIQCESEIRALNDEPHTNFQIEREECQVFGELVAVKLRKLDSRTRAYVQHLINNTLFRAEMGMLKNVNSN